MTTKACLPVQSGRLRPCRLRMRIVASAAPEPVLRLQLAFAPGKLLGVVGSCTLPIGLVPHKDRQMIGQQITGTERTRGAAGAGNSCGPGQVTLLADAVAAS